LNSDSPELPQLLTVTQVGQRLGLCRRSVERLIASQQLRACKIGRATRIAVAELVRFVNGLHQGPTPTGGAS
jgi:excisionase family DNA binding protein